MLWCDVCVLVMVVVVVVYYKCCIALMWGYDIYLEIN